MTTRRTWNERCADIVKTQPKYGFTIRGQELNFETREDYLKAFSRVLDLAAEQEKRIHTETLVDTDIEEALLDSDTEEQYDLFQRGMEVERSRSHIED